MIDYEIMLSHLQEKDMEVYCLENPGTFCFNRPIYCDLSWRPCQTEFGLLTAEKNFLIERFEN